MRSTRLPSRCRLVIRPGGVRQPRQLGEGRAALVVDQHERERVRRVAQRQPRDERAQQLALARAGGAHDQAVRTEPALGRLLQIERDRLAGAAHADRHPQLLAPGPRPPARTRVHLGGGAEAEAARAPAPRRRSPGRARGPPGAAGRACGRSPRSGRGRRRRATRPRPVRPRRGAPRRSRRRPERARCERRPRTAPRRWSPRAARRSRRGGRPARAPRASAACAPRPSRRPAVHEQDEVRAGQPRPGGAVALLVEPGELLEPRPHLALEQPAERLARTRPAGSAAAAARARPAARAPRHARAAAT